MIKRIPLSALKVGMYITDLNNDWIPHNTQRKRGVVKQEDTVEKIRQLGVDFVYIDVSKGLDSQDSEPASEVDRRNESALQQAGELSPGVFKKVSITEEMGLAQQIHSQAQSLGVVYGANLGTTATAAIAMPKATANDRPIGEVPEPKISRPGAGQCFCEQWRKAQTTFTTSEITPPGTETPPSTPETGKTE